jgi:hypothetical protein
MKFQFFYNDGEIASEKKYNLELLPKSGDTVRFKIGDMVVSGIVSKIVYDYTTLTVAVIGTWLKNY